MISVRSDKEVTTSRSISISHGHMFIVLKISWQMLSKQRTLKSSHGRLNAMVVSDCRCALNSDAAAAASWSLNTWHGNGSGHIDKAGKTRLDRGLSQC